MVAITARSTTAAPLSGACLPPGVDPAATGRTDAPTTSKPGPMRVYVDRSGSMGGYVRGVTYDLHPIGDFLSNVSLIEAGRAAPARFFSFGEKITESPDFASATRLYGTLVPYICRGCDNRKSHIGDVFDDILRSDRSTLNIVVTDLMLDNQRDGASPRDILGSPLARMLAQGRAIGLLGIRAPFSGPVYDLPGGGQYRGATERPLYIVFIGPRADVSRVHAAMARWPSSTFGPGASPGRSHYSMFAGRLDNPWIPATALAASGGGVAVSADLPPERFPGVRQFVINLGTARAQRGAITGQFSTRVGLRDNGVWTGPPRFSTRVWSLRDPGLFSAPTCDRSTWTAVPPLNNPWSLTADGAWARFTLSPATAAALEPGHHYFVAATIGVSRLGTPNPADAWMRDGAWSFDASEEAAVTRRRPSFFPTLNLGQLAASMETALEDGAPGGLDTTDVGFLVSIRR